MQEVETRTQDVAAGGTSKFDEITERFEKLPFMRAAQAEIIRDLIRETDAKDILEIGFFHGKSSAYIGAILEDLGRGTLVTIDDRSALGRDPTIHDVLRMAGLAHRVQPIFAFRSFTWELQKVISQVPRPHFDLCYFDGGHTWDNTGFGVVLVDILLRPGGLLVLDDMNWRVESSPTYKNPKRRARFSEDETAAPTVRRAWELTCRISATPKCAISRRSSGASPASPAHGPRRLSRRWQWRRDGEDPKRRDQRHRSEVPVRDSVLLAPPVGFALLPVFPLHGPLHRARRAQHDRCRFGQCSLSRMVRLDTRPGVDRPRDSLPLRSGARN